MSKEKIAILGGGISALTTAYELTNVKNWQDKYDLTIYQVGWRLGGKLSTGRGPYDRIEEYGIHLLLGCYNNAFRMYKEAYLERKNANLSPDCPYQKIEDAISPNNSMTMMEYLKDRNDWVNWTLILPEREGEPGCGPNPSVMTTIKEGIGIILEILLGSPYKDGQWKIIREIIEHFLNVDDDEFIELWKKEKENNKDTEHSIWKELVKKVDDAVDSFEDWVERGLEGLFDDMASLFSRWVKDIEPSIESLSNVLELILKLLRRIYDDANDETNSIRRIILLVEFAAVVLRGLKKDVWNPETKQFDFNKINHYDFREWLKLNGGSDELMEFSIVRFTYMAVFCEFNDGNQQGGSLAAGTALNFIFLANGYKGSFINLTKIGTADTLVMPLFQILRHRGVQFKFFHNVKNVITNSSNNEIESILLEKQVKLINEDYKPEIIVKGIPSWPSHPNYDQIDPGQAKILKEKEIDLESPWADWTEGEEITLVKGSDFDQVLLTIPPAAQKDSCKGLIEKSEKWNYMVNFFQSTQVISTQFWFKKGLEDLGFDRGKWGLGEHESNANIVTYENPLCSWLDLSQYIENENWPEDNKPDFMAIFLGPLANARNIPGYEDHSFPKSQYDRVFEITKQWFQDNSVQFFPKATAPVAPQGLYYEELFDPNENSKGIEKLYYQFYIAGINPTERYNLAPPYKKAYRIKPGESGYNNLTVAGDWTDYGPNFGFMEGAVTSGILAAKHIAQLLGFGLEREVFCLIDVKE